MKGAYSAATSRRHAGGMRPWPDAFEFCFSFATRRETAEAVMRSACARRSPACSTTSRTTTAGRCTIPAKETRRSCAGWKYS
eukprot:CAMPEP_0185315096 /NCGR_PEP_ID=MMETSP1363-20130426/40597_1 /TAXON_ID=38817 /ORGANISM="Gephyrocapsa oceanica, Strain RCC1303" /LENGTH=81 /DNA_ID=CAMNT_0027913185 /DNA_START=19 /DNA_END=261 /DNA_ORIENTATION=+